MTREIAVIYARQGIRANALCPGPIMTPMLAKFLSATTPSATVAWCTSRWAASANRSRSPTARCSWPRDESSWMTGQSLIIDGGITAAYVDAGVRRPAARHGQRGRRSHRSRRRLDQQAAGRIARRRDRRQAHTRCRAGRLDHRGRTRHRSRRGNSSTQIVAPNNIGLDSERFLAFIPLSPSVATVWMDAIVSAANFSAESWLEGAGAVAAENQVIELLCRRCRDARRCRRAVS